MRDRIFKTKGPLDPAKDQAILVERREIWQILRLATQPSVSGYVALLSPRQTGKTTLLYQVRAQLGGRDYGVAFVDLSPLENRDESECYQYVCRQILTDLGGQLRLPRTARDKLQEVAGPISFRDFLWEVAQRARPSRLVIMLDEVKAIPSSIANTFFGTIRSVFSSRRKESEQALEKYVFIFAGATELWELTSGENSPLNICETIRLQDFDADGVWSLVANLKRADIEVSKEASDYIYEQTRGHPYLTQRVCSILEVRAVPVVTIPTIDEAVVEILRGDENLDHITRQLDKEPKARDLARQIVAGKRPIAFSRVNRHISRLEMIGVISDDHPCAIRNPIYRRALARHLGTSLVAQGLRANLGRYLSFLLLALLLLLPLPTIFLYTTEVVLAERFVNQPIALPALNITGYIRHDSLISIGKDQEIEVEILRSPDKAMSPIEVKLQPHEDDLTSADGNYKLVYTKEHESQRFLIRLRKSARLQDIIFPFLTQRERHLDLFVAAASETLSLAGGVGQDKTAPCYTAIMKVDYLSSFLGSLLVWVVSLLASIGNLLSHFDACREWPSHLLRVLRLGKREI